MSCLSLFFELYQLPSIIGDYIYSIIFPDENPIELNDTLEYNCKSCNMKVDNIHKHVISTNIKNVNKNIYCSNECLSKDLNNLINN